MEHAVMTSEFSSSINIAHNEDDCEMECYSSTSSVGPARFPRMHCVSATDASNKTTGRVFWMSDEELSSTDDNEESEGEASHDRREAARAEQRRREALIHGPTRANYSSDRQSIMSVRQNQLNNFILKHAKAATVSRHDHHIMLRQLIGEAYFNDAEHRGNRQHWRRIVAAVRREYWGSNAIFTLSPDPYHNVLATISSMMLWDGATRRWEYKYADDEINRRQERQQAVLEELRRDGKLFL